VLLVAAEASDFSEQLFDALRSWSSCDLLSTFILNDASEGGALRSRLVSGGKVREEPLNHLLANFVGELTIHWLTVAAQDPSGVESEGRTCANLVLSATSDMVSSLKVLKRLRVLASDRPSASFQNVGDAGWPYRVYLVPEDRGRPDALSNLIPERMIVHVAAGLCALGGLWKSPRTPDVPDVIDWITDEEQGNQPDTLWLVRQFTRIVEMPTLYNELLEGVPRENDSYPNPDLEKYERVDLSDQVDSFATAFVNHFGELQAELPALLREEAVIKRSLRRAIAELMSYMASRIVEKPVELLDDALGKVYDAAATLVEGAFPGNTVSVERWSEIGKDPTHGEHAVSDLLKGSGRLIEADIGHVWEEYWKLCTSLIDGGDHSDILGDRLFLTTKDRRQIAQSPSEIVRDPVTIEMVGELVNETQSPGDPISSDSESGTQSESNSATNIVGGKPSASTIPLPETDSGFSEVVHQQAAGEIATALPSIPIVETSKPSSENDLSFTGRVRQIVESSLAKETAKVVAIDAANAQMAEKSEGTKVGKPRGWLYRLFHRSKGAGIGVGGHWARKTTHSIWGALIFGFAISISVTVFLVVEHHPWWAIGALAFLLILTFVTATLQAFRGWRREKSVAKEEQSKQMAVINAVITEATVRRNQQSLTRRVDEVIDWNHIIGVVVHHPWKFEKEMQAEDTAAVVYTFPLAVMKAEGVLESGRVRALQHQFNNFLFQKGWLGARFKELEDRAKEEIAETFGPEAGSLRAIEADTSLDPDSPRRQFARLVDARLLSNGSATDLQKKVNEFLADGRPVGQLISEVKGSGSEQNTEGGETEPITDFFSIGAENDESFLPAHWLEGMSEGESKVDSSLVFGDGVDSTFEICTTDASEVVNARLIRIVIEKSRRIGTASMRAFQAAQKA
jgi:hypothetical protein